MKLSEDFHSEQVKSSISLGTMMTLVIVFIGVVVISVIAVNQKSNSANRTPNTQVQPNLGVSSNTSVMDDYTTHSNLTSDDLDFWDMYKDDKDSAKHTSSDTIDYETKTKELLDKEKEAEKEADLSENGTKTEVILPDGSSLWVMINAYIEKNTYDYVGLVSEEPYMRYYDGGKKISKQGIMLDENAKVTSFEKIEDAGIDFCMLRIGYRGYASGEIAPDRKFLEYANSAKAAGLKIGITFNSQAMTVEEAKEEANFIVNALRDNEITVTYPIIFDMETISTDEARTKNMTKTQLTEVAKAFVDEIETHGYTGVVYGDKYWLLRKLDLTQMVHYDFFLNQILDVPDYPYTFVMWQYKQDATIDGVSAKIPMCISFIDYDMR